MRTTCKKVLVHFPCSTKDKMLCDSGFSYHVGHSMDHASLARVAQNYGVAVADQGGGPIKRGDVVYYIYAVSLGRYNEASSTSLSGREFYVDGKLCLLLREDEVMAYSRSGKLYSYSSWHIFEKVDFREQSISDVLSIPSALLAERKSGRLICAPCGYSNRGLRLGGLYVLNQKFIFEETIEGKNVYAVKDDDAIKGILCEFKDTGL